MKIKVKVKPDSKTEEVSQEDDTFDECSNPVSEQSVRLSHGTWEPSNGTEVGLIIPIVNLGLTGYPVFFEQMSVNVYHLLSSGGSKSASK